MHEKGGFKKESAPKESRTLRKLQYHTKILMAGLFKREELG